MQARNRFQTVSLEALYSDIADSAPERNLVLIGIMGVGKSEAGKLSARRLGYEFIDTDTLIEERAGRTIPDIFREQGEAGFRAIEREIVSEVCSGTCQVIATGGGVPLDPQNRSLLVKAGVVVYLTATPGVILGRLKDLSSRPLLAGFEEPENRLTELLIARDNVYRSVANQTISTDQMEADAVAVSIVNYFQSLNTTTSADGSLVQKLVMDLGDRSYPLWMAPGLLASSAGTIISAAVGSGQACIVTHRHLRRPYADPIAKQLELLGVTCSVVVIPQGESVKNLKTVRRLYSEFVSAGLDRRSVVIAVGGGVIGDIAGFAAASFLRGIKYVQIPTTLLAQVDSSIGGKTGVDLPEGKNLVGAFHQPSAVLIDLATLNTLPIRELRAGLAEVIKYGIITDRAFFCQVRDDLPSILSRDPVALSRAIGRSCEIKGAVVSEDETEQGVRAILNFGHTVGHALESVTNYSRYRHGEAVAIGMVSACLVGEELGITPPDVTSSVRSILVAAGLPVNFPEDIQEAPIQAAMKLDKKSESGNLRFVLADELGSVRMVTDVDPQAVGRAISRQKLLQ